MGITISVVAETTGLTTVAAVKSVLGRSANGKDAEITRLIDAATDAIEEWCGRAFARQTYVETVAGSDHPLLMVTNTPIIGTPTIVCDSSPITDFEVRDAEAGILYREVGWARGEWAGWNVERWAKPGTEPLQFAVTYEAGYYLPGQSDRNLPGQIEQATVETIAAWFRSSRRDPAVKSKKIGDLALTFATVEGEAAQRVLGIPPSARALLSRRVK
jgi:hypothetical protein